MFAFAKVRIQVRLSTSFKNSGSDLTIFPLLKKNIISYSLTLWLILRPHSKVFLKNPVNFSATV